MSQQGDPNDPKLLRSLGPNPIDMARGKIPMNRMGIHTPFSAEYWSYARVRALMGSRFWAVEYEEGMDQEVGVDGRGRIQLIHGESVRHGAAADLRSEIRRPDSWLERNVTRRDWEDEEKKRLGITDEHIE